MPGPEPAPGLAPELLTVVTLVAVWLIAEVDPILVVGDAADAWQQSSKQKMSKKARDLGMLR